MRPRRAKKLIPGAFALIAVACLWFFFAPTALGGKNNYVVTDGISMEPRFHGGDLAVVRSQSSYKVGEIVAYHNHMFHTVVLHRIVGMDGSRYVFKGDNNNFLDFEHPAQSQLMGALWLHLPGMGTKLKSLRSPALVGVLVAIAILLFGGAAFTRRRRRRMRDRRLDQDQSSSTRRVPRRPLAASPGILGAAAIVLLPFLALTVLGFSRASQALLPYSVPYKQSAKLHYVAAATPGPAYPDDRAVTGMPLFTHVVRDVELGYDYHFVSSAPHSLAGTASLDAKLSSTAGWQMNLQLAPPAPFRGDHADVAAVVNLASLEALMHRVETLTAVSGSYSLTIIPHVSVSGSVGHMPLRTSYAPEIKFSLTKVEVAPVISEAVAAEGSNAAVFSPSKSGSTEGKRDQPLYLSFGVAHMTVSSARWIGLVGLLLVGLGVIVLLAIIRRRFPDEATAAKARYGRLIVPVERVWQIPGVPVIDVTDMEALVRIAGHYERSILHETTPDGDAFWVTDESGQFRYAVGGQSLRTREQPTVVSPPVPTPAPAAEQDSWLGDDVFAEEPPVLPLPIPEPVAGETSPVAEDEAPEEPTVAEQPSLEQLPVESEEPEPVPVEPVYEEPAYVEPASVEAVYSEPVYEEPAYVEPAPVEPVYEEPAYIQPAAVEPMYTEPVPVEPVYSEPVYEEPAYVEPAPAEPVYSEPAPVEPAYTEPVYGEPAYPEASYTESSYTEPAYTEPSYSEPVYEQWPGPDPYGPPGESQPIQPAANDLPSFDPAIFAAVAPPEQPLVEAADAQSIGAEPLAPVNGDGTADFAGHPVESWPIAEQPPVAEEQAYEQWANVEEQQAAAEPTVAGPTFVDSEAVAEDPVAAEAHAYGQWADGAAPTLVQETVPWPVADGTAASEPAQPPEPRAGDLRSGPHHFRGQRPLDRISRRWVRIGR